MSRTRLIMNSGILLAMGFEVLKWLKKPLGEIRTYLQSELTAYREKGVQIAEGLRLSSSVLEYYSFFPTVFMSIARF